MGDNRMLTEFLWAELLNGLFYQKAIVVPTDFKSRCASIEELLENDITGVIKTILQFSVDSASEASYRIECGKNDSLEMFLNDWFSKINSNLMGQIPVGSSELAKEYFKERWMGSSLIVLRAETWEEININGAKISLPQNIYIVKGSSVKIKSPDDKNFSLGSYEYFLNNDYKIPHGKNELMLVQKPFDRWYTRYPTPYLIGNGVYKNAKALQILGDKADEVVTKIIPYIMLMKRGTEGLALQGEQEFTDEDLKEQHKEFQNMIENYKSNRGKTPLGTFPFDTQFEHFIPDIKNLFNEDIYNQGYRALLAGLGFIDVVQGISSTRKESVLNPKPFVAQVNSGIKDYSDLMVNLLKMIAEKNKDSHKKLFSDTNKIRVIPSPIKLNIESILDVIRGGYDRGNISRRSYVESMGFDYDTEKERREVEYKEGAEDIMYPQVIQNQESAPDNRVSPTKERKIDDEKQGKKPGTPEAEQYKNASSTFAPCKKCGTIICWERLKESGMGYVNCPYCGEQNTQKDNEEMNKKYKDDLEISIYNMKNYPEYLKQYPEGAIKVWIDVFNETIKDGKGEDRAFPYAWTALKRWMKKNGYKKNGDKWEKSDGK